MTRAASLRIAAAVALVLATGPTPGDIGGCGQAPDPLDAPRFYAVEQALTCKGCRECGIATRACAGACAAAPTPQAFPTGCRPLVHDGEVCLDRLRVGSCDDWSRWAADEGATAPGECEFCPP